MFPVESFRNTLAKAVDIFQRHAIRFHLTGGLTSVLYGEPRMTQDIDIVIDNPAIASQLDSFISSLNKSDFYVRRRGDSPRGRTTRYVPVVR